MAIKIELQKTVEVEAKTIHFTAKCSDCFGGSIHDQDGKQIGEDLDGYVPDFFPEGGGDYIIFKIDLETGKILNWQVPTVEDIEKMVNGDE